MASKDMARRIADEANSTASNSLLLKHARLSPEEIEEKTGIPAREAMARLSEILRTRDWMTEKMEERLLLVELADLISSVKERAENATEQYYADIIGIAMRGYEAISKRMDARRKLTEEDISRISAAQGEMMMSAISLALDMTAEYIRELHPELDLDDDLRAGFQRSLPEAYETVKKNIRE